MYIYQDVKSGMIVNNLFINQELLIECMQEVIILYIKLGLYYEIAF